MRTARSRFSGEYLLDLFITPSSQEMESPTNPGRFTESFAHVDPLIPTRYESFTPKTGSSTRGMTYRAEDITENIIYIIPICKSTCTI